MAKGERRTPASQEAPFRNRRALSLFSGAGLGDLGLRAAGYSITGMSEIDADRSALAELNFPEAKHYSEDIRSARDRIIEETSATLGDHSESLFLVTCTAPCQGMSKNGQGTLLRNARLGKRPSLDPRNRLVLTGLEIVRELRPLWVVFENVVEMRNTVIEDHEGQMVLILEAIRGHLEPEYQGFAYDIEFADYGVPQRRQRLITVYTRDTNAIELVRLGAELIPPKSHSANGENGALPWVTVSEAIRDFAVLDARAAELASDPGVPFHRVPLLDERKYEWVRRTPPGRSAFDNQCAAPDCGWTGNETHGTSRDHEGVNRANKGTPLHCARCGGMLPRPHTIEKSGEVRIMSGFTSAYKRMRGDLPAPTITRNVSYACSDQKLHPTQNRVLSLAEAMRLQTIDRYDYRWGPVPLRKGSRSVVRPVAPDTLMRVVIGESIPPLFMELLGKHLERVSFRGAEVTRALAQRERQLTLC